MKKIFLAASASIFLALAASAQSNQGGVVQLGLSLMGGAYATEYEQTAFGDTETNSDGAASVSFPFELHVGLAKPVSLGFYLQPGSYLDSSATRSNGFFIAGLAPRFYAVNNDRFNLWLGLEMGFSSLVIQDTYEDIFGEEEDIQWTFAGGHFRLASGVNIYFGDLVGLQAGLKYAGYNLPLRDIEPDFPDFDSKLKVSGVEVNIGVVFKLGGGD